MNAAPVLDRRTTNTFWASVLVETLVRSGVRCAVVSPGSRSTPLTIALARHPGIEAIPVLDERSAAFFALGLAKVDLQPVVLVCTSGTAAANYFPAIVEAHESGVPLLVITADRPPEMRASASGQTIDQQKLFGNYVGFYHELAVPDLDAARFRYLRQTMRHAVARTLVPQRGPVHLNAPFRDPLPPLADGGVAERFADTIDWARFFETMAAGSEMGSNPTAALLQPSQAVAELAHALVPDAHGLIVVGPNQPTDGARFAERVGEVATQLGWPVIADALSPVRLHAARVPQVVTSYDTILRNASAAERLKPEIVLCLGEWPTSKVLRSWLEATDAPTWLVSERSDNRDALHGRTTQVAIGLEELTSVVPAGTGSSGYAAMWSRYEQRARAALDQRVNDSSDLVEPKAAWLLAQQLPPQTPIVIANSMPIRDAEYFWPAGDRALRVLCNRGANGIDGTLSTALGVAQASGRPSVLLTGDLALLHDSNGGLLRAKFGGSLTIVLINNRGGGIFEHLPVAQFDPPFEEFFATPQDVDFVRWCATYGIEHVTIRDWAQFAALIGALPATGVRLLEIRTDRKRDAALRKQWFAEVASLQ